MGRVQLGFIVRTELGTQHGGDIIGFSESGAVAFDLMMEQEPEFEARIAQGNFYVIVFSSLQGLHEADDMTTVQRVIYVQHQPAFIVGLVIEAE